MEKLNDVHEQFAEYFPDKKLRPFLYILSKRLAEGNICVPLQSILPDDLPEVYQSLLTEADLKNHDKVSGAEANHPIVFVDGNLYLQRYYKYESRILQNIIARIKAEIKDESAKQSLLQHKDYIAGLFGYTGKKLNWQLAAAISAVLNNFTIITGGPGTGKTTTVAATLEILRLINPGGLRIALAAPTGKAAGRMAESLKKAGEKLGGQTELLFSSLVPFTIHRLLGTQKGSNYFRYNEHNRLPYDIIVADESSMLDVALFSKFLDAVPQTCKLILLGDKNQLAAVEAGSLFGDLCQAQECLNLFAKERAEFLNEFIPAGSTLFAENSNSNDSEHLLFQHVIELQHSYRFSADDGIGKLSQAVIGNNVEIIESFYTNQNPEVTLTEDGNDKIFESFAGLYLAYIKEKDIALALQKFNELRILCAVREGKDGVFAMNRKVELLLQKQGLIRVSGTIYENRPVLVTENNYELGLFNGDIGITRADENNVMKVWFEKQGGGLQGVLAAYLPAADTAFAMTIHKSQGSEFEKVFITLPSFGSTRLLSRELLYTGITRAKKQVIICTTKEVLLQAAATRLKRSSGLAARLAGKHK